MLIPKGTRTAFRSEGERASERSDDGSLSARVNQIAVHPFQNELPHLGQLHVPTVEQLNATVLSMAIFRVKRHQMVANFFNAGGWRQPILPPIDTQTWSGND